jgi:large subunit ribosomal protein L6
MNYGTNHLWLRTKSAASAAEIRSTLQQKSTSSITMTSFLSQTCSRQLARGSLPKRSPTIPAPLSFSQPLRCFSTTLRAQSRVGGAPVSVPPEVSLKFIDLPQVQGRGAGKDQPKVAVEVNGPLGGFHLVFSFRGQANMTATAGQLTLNIPSFVNIAHDENLRKASLTVADPSVPHQRAMWGVSFPCFQ